LREATDKPQPQNAVAIVLPADYCALPADIYAITPELKK
jgi:hypothetical protein